MTRDHSSLLTWKFSLYHRLHGPSWSSLMMENLFSSARLRLKDISSLTRLLAIWRLTALGRILHQHVLRQAFSAPSVKVMFALAPTGGILLAAQAQSAMLWFGILKERWWVKANGRRCQPWLYSHMPAKRPYVNGIRGTTWWRRRIKMWCFGCQMNMLGSKHFEPLYDKIFSASYHCKRVDHFSAFSIDQVGSYCALPEPLWKGAWTDSISQIDDDGFQTKADCC